MSALPGLCPSGYGPAAAGLLVETTRRESQPLASPACLIPSPTVQMMMLSTQSPLAPCDARPSASTANVCKRPQGRRAVLGSLAGRPVRAVLGLALVGGLCSVADVTLFASAPAEASVEKLQRIVVVDVSRCILETAHGQREKKKLETEFASRNAKLQSKGAALQKEASDLQAKAAMLSESELARRQQDLMVKDQELQKLSAEYSQEMAAKQEQFAERILKNLTAVTKQIALEDDIQIVLVRSPDTVMYANPKFDITNRVILAYDKKYP